MNIIKFGSNFLIRIELICSRRWWRALHDQY